MKTTVTIIKKKFKCEYEEILVFIQFKHSYVLLYFSSTNGLIEKSCSKVEKVTAVNM